MTEKRKVLAYQVDPPLFDAMVGVLNELPARQVRVLLNRIENGQVRPIFDTGDLGGHKVRDPDPPPPAPGKKAKKRRSVARKRGGK